MAKAEVIKAEPRYVLELNQEEAEVLLYIVGHLMTGPSEAGSPRSQTDNIYYALTGCAGLQPRIDSGWTINGSMSAKRKVE